MRRNYITILALLVCCAFTACGTGPDCSMDDRVGTYLVKYDERPDGTCGIGNFEALIVVSNNDNAGSDSADSEAENCRVDFKEISEDECSLTSRLTCTSRADNIATEFIAYTEQMDDNGGELQGTTTITFRYLDTGAIYCISTFDLTYIRQ